MRELQRQKLELLSLQQPNQENTYDMMDGDDSHLNDQSAVVIGEVSRVIKQQTTSGSSTIPEQIFSNNDVSLTAGFNLTDHDTMMRQQMTSNPLAIDQSLLVKSVEGYPQERVRNFMPTEMTEESRIYNNNKNHRVVHTLLSQ